MTAASTPHPYMANSVDALKREMLDAIGAESVADLFEQIPADHRLRRPLNLPPSLSSESELRRHLIAMLRKNQTCEANLSFLGAGCWQHHVPAVCDELVRRTEWLTSVFGSPMSDHGRNQAWFEFCSQIGELVNMDMVGLPVYSWGCAVGHAIRMASRITGRHEVLIVRPTDPERLAVIRSYCEPSEMPGHIEAKLVGFDRRAGGIDLADLSGKLSSATAAVYFEVPSYLGMIEVQAAEIARLARANGAETIVGVDPISLGVLAAPADYGADIVVGTTQPLGVHMNCGGGVGGFIATRDEEVYAREYPSLMISITDTVKEGEFGFGLSLFHQTSYGMRDKGKDWTGNSVYLWTIANAAYMALLGPQGFADLGALIVERAHYAAALLARIPGVRIAFPSGFFKEFVVTFDGTGKSVADINRALLARGIFGGKDLSAELPELGHSALYCVTEIHAEEDIERFAGALREVVAS
ncbi:MAG: aminomethyl-transferring glycine dehydrogenase subunit GcvPA [Methylobacteriaceae bacterium]|nr:aminomethyl-transferring glycine dehydrogenase subunit GcvPA [Methylobacteriaceae bacterium]